MHRRRKPCRLRCVSPSVHPVRQKSARSSCVRW
nr:MAG TPA: hypothetical protein [Caudoviricetes sp.]